MLPTLFLSQPFLPLICRVYKIVLSRFPWLLLTLLLQNCAALPPTDQSAWEERQAKITSLAVISYQARVHIASEGRSWQFSLHWRQQGESFSGTGYSLLLGTQLFTLSGNAKHTSYDFGENRQEVLSSNEIIHQFTELSLTPNELFALLAAIPDPAAQQQWTQGRLASQTLGELSIQYPKWQTYSGLQMPRQVRIRSGDNQLNLSFSNWELGETVNNL